MYLIINFGTFAPMLVISELAITPLLGYVKNMFVKYKNIQI